MSKVCFTDEVLIFTSQLFPFLKIVHALRLLMSPNFTCSKLGNDNCELLNFIKFLKVFSRLLVSAKQNLPLQKQDIL